MDNGLLIKNRQQRITDSSQGLLEKICEFSGIDGQRSLQVIQSGPFHHSLFLLNSFTLSPIVATSAGFFVFQKYI